MTLNARHSNKTGERRLHAAIPAFIGGMGLILSAYLRHQPGAVDFLPQRVRLRRC